MSDTCLTAQLASFCERHAVLGAALSVVDSAGARTTATCGFGDRAKTRPVRATDRFRVGSVTKTFTAALTMRWVDRASVSLDDTAAKFGVEVDNADLITVRQLLAHTSGLVDYNNDDAFDWDKAWTIPEVVEWVRVEREPAAAPGRAFTYSGTGFQVLAQIIGAEGRPPYPDALRAELLAPLALADTYLHGAETLDGGHVEGSRREGSGFKRPAHSNDWASADGSIAASAPDLSTWMQRLFIVKDVLSASSLDAMTTPTLLPDGSPAMFLGHQYGLGLGIEKAAAGPVYFHGGADFGFHAYVAAQPSTGRVVTAVVNTEDVDIFALGALGWTLLRHGD